MGSQLQQSHLWQMTRVKLPSICIFNVEIILSLVYLNWLESITAAQILFSFRFEQVLIESIKQNHVISFKSPPFQASFLMGTVPFTGDLPSTWLTSKLLSYLDPTLFAQRATRSCGFSLPKMWPILRLAASLMLIQRFHLQTWSWSIAYNWSQSIHFLPSVSCSMESYIFKQNPSFCFITSHHIFLHHFCFRMILTSPESFITQSTRPPG